MTCILIDHSQNLNFSFFLNLGRFKLAEKDLIKALELKPDFTDALRNLEQVQRDLKNGHRFNQADELT